MSQQNMWILREKVLKLCTEVALSVHDINRRKKKLFKEFPSLKISLKKKHHTTTPDKTLWKVCIMRKSKSLTREGRRNESVEIKKSNKKSLNVISQTLTLKKDLLSIFNYTISTPPTVIHTVVVIVVIIKTFPIYKWFD